MDEFTRECLAIDVAKKLTSEDVLERLSDLFVCKGVPDHIRSDNTKLRNELLEREAFDKLLEAKVLIERWRQHYNTIRPHSALSYRPPAPPGVAAPCVRMACASANARDWSIGGQNPNLRTGVIHGGRSKR